MPSTDRRPPSGFYPDPSGAPYDRFWDGERWMGYTRPFRPPAPPARRPWIVFTPGGGSKPMTLGSAVVLLLMGVVWTAGSLWFQWVDSDSRIDHGVSATGTVDHVTSHRGTKGGRTCAPVVRYKVRGVWFEVTTNSWTSGWCSAYPGQRVHVVYDATRPAHANVSPRAGDSAFVWVFVGIGLLIVALGFNEVKKQLRARLRGGHDPTMGPAGATPAQGDPPAMWTGRVPRF